MKSLSANQNSRPSIDRNALVAGILLALAAMPVLAEEPLRRQRRRSGGASELAAGPSVRPQVDIQLGCHGGHLRLSAIPLYRPEA